MCAKRWRAEPAGRAGNSCACGGRGNVAVVMGDVRRPWPRTRFRGGGHCTGWAGKKQSCCRCRASAAQSSLAAHGAMRWEQHVGCRGSTVIRVCNSDESRAKGAAAPARSSQPICALSSSVHWPVTVSTRVSLPSPPTTRRLTARHWQTGCLALPARSRPHHYAHPPPLRPPSPTLTPVTGRAGRLE